MTLEPANWNAIAVGGWNPHILSPEGIAQHVFGLQPGTPVQLELAIDVPTLYRVSHNGFTVTPAAQRLDVSTEKRTFRAMCQAAGLLKKAMESLPVTPVGAAGLNIRYRLSDPDHQLLPRFKVSLDDDLSDAGFTIQRRRLSWTLEHGTGVINLKVETAGADQYDVEMNLDCRSGRADILTWLATTPEELHGTTRRIIENVLGATLPEEIDAA
jgi:hypothetical protein